MLDRLKQILIRVKNEPRYPIVYILNKGNLNKLSDENYLKLFFKYVMGTDLNLDNPKTFNEKIQWLKLNDKNPDYSKLVDKYEVREHIKKTVGEEYLVPLYGMWDSFDDIDFSVLPNKFVLKTTHDCGGVVICKDKSQLDLQKAKDKLNQSMNRNYFYPDREWPYKNIQPRIICEWLIETDDGLLPSDYKIHCFDGEPDNVMVCTERDSGKPKFYFFNQSWEVLKYNKTGLEVGSDFTLAKPEKLEEMFSIARELSKNLPFVRVDLYFEKGEIYFGEMTFYPQSGFDSNLLPQTDILFGEKIKAV